MESSGARNILVVTRRDTTEVDGVIDELRGRGFSIVRWNLCQFPENESAIILGGGASPSVGFLQSQFAAAWLHDSGSLSVLKSLEGLPREVALRECTAFWEGSLLQLSTRWLNPPAAVRTASNKVLQLVTAERLGIRVPPFVVTNDPRPIRQLLLDHGAIVIKNLATGYLEYGAKRLKFYTRKMTEFPSDFVASLRFGPVIVQQAISKVLEYRVTVVDQDCFAVAIDCTGLDDATVDTRQIDFSKERERFKGIDLPDIEFHSRRIVASLGLSYAGVDWAVDECGNVFFLECNPLGAFKWYEIVCGRSITSSLSAALERRTWPQ
jgi:hypothetical protein